MSNMVTVNSTIIYKKVVPVLKDYQQIAGAVHFGSSLCDCRPDSDIDIGLIFNVSSVRKEREYDQVVEKVLSELTPINSHSFDVLVINTLPNVLAFRILKEGNIFYQSDSEMVTDFMEQVSRRYAEDYPRYFRALQLVAEV